VSSLTETTRIVSPSIRPGGVTFWSQDELRFRFTLLELGGCGAEVISEQLAVDVEVVEVIRRFFFDINDNRTAIGWIDAHVMAPERSAGCFLWAAQYGAAFSGGSAVAVKILRLEAIPSENEASRLQFLEQALHVKVREALEMPLEDAGDSAKVITATLDYELRKNRLEFERAKCRRRSEREVRNHELAERRTHLAEENLRVQVEFSSRQKEVRQGSSNRAQLAKLQQSLQLERHHREQVEAANRAAACPLSALTWSKLPPEQPLKSDLGQVPQVRERQHETVTFTSIGIATEDVHDLASTSLTVDV
jgi:hypothetical protein